MGVALSEVIRERERLQPQSTPKHVFDKCLKYTRADEVRDAGLYPYFYAIDKTEGNVVEVEGRKMIMLGSNNYLGLTMDPRVKEAARDALNAYGTSCSGSRFLNGTLALHEELEERLADWMGKESALVLTTGYTTNMALGCLLGRGEIALMDISNHASLYEAVQTGYATLKRFGHVDPDDLRRRLDHLDPDKGKLLLTDGVFSMEGTLAPLQEYVRIKNEYGFPMVVDDAHALGVMGPNGRGTAEALGVHDEVEIITGTFSKCFASLGGVIAGPAKVLDYVKHNGRAMIFAASMAPPAVGAALKSLEIISTEPEHRQRVMANAAFMRKELAQLGFTVSTDPTPVVAIFIGDEARAFATWRSFHDQGLFTNLAVPPGVPPGRSLIRTSYMATHTQEHLDQALSIIERVGRQVGLI